MAKIIAGNWKSCGSTHQCAELLDGIIANAAEVDSKLIVTPSYPYLSMAHARVADIANIHLAAQNISAHKQGAFTGEVEGSMLKDIGCDYVIIGHSERRSMMGETDDIVIQKTLRASENALIPIICVGESLEERENGAAYEVVGQQVEALYKDAQIASAMQGAIIAYEPVWAIGTGKSASSSDAEEMHEHIRGVVQRHDAVQSASLDILYGGSVKPDTAEALFAQPNIGGALVGGASLDAQSFIAIAKAGA